MRYLRLIYTVGFIVMAYVSIGQKSIISQADKYFEKEKYYEALDLYNQVENILENDDLLYRRGVSNFHLNKYNQALEDLTYSFTLGNRSADLYLYAGKSLHSLGQYEKASAFYKDYLSKEDNLDKRYPIIEEIKKLGYAYNMQYADQLAYVENIGSSVNSIADEISPVQSPNQESKYYFSSNREGSTGGMRNKEGYRDDIYGQYFYDLYGVELKNGNWSSIIAFDPILNGPKHDIIHGFSNHGNVLFYNKSLDMETGILLTDTFRMNRPSELIPERFSGPIDAESGDNFLQIFNNNTILFSSNSLEGYGGYDIYVTHFNNGRWSDPINLGPEINTPYNEIDPYLTHSGTKIYFSSDRLDGYGGYDIFTNSFGLETRKWGVSTNMGLPVNSPNDDRYFSLSSDGQTGIMSSDRDGSLGGFDIYTVYLKKQVIEQSIFSSVLPFINYSDETHEEVQIAALQDTIETENTDTPTTIEKKELYIKDLFYGDDENVLNPTNKVTINYVLDLMKVYPKTELVLTGNSIMEGLAEFDLFFSIKRAEKIAEYIIDRGISPQRIHVKGLGPNFPLVQMSKLNTSRTAKINNRRIDITILSKGENIKVIKEKPNLIDNIKDPRADQYLTTVKGLSYKVNFATVKQMYRGDVLKNFPGATIEKRMDDDLYVYSSGIFSTYKEARITKNELLRNNILEATIQPYIDGVKLQPHEVSSLVAQYPDLKDYLSFEE